MHVMNKLMTFESKKMFYRSQASSQHDGKLVIKYYCNNNCKQMYVFSLSKIKISVIYVQNNYSEGISTSRFVLTSMFAATTKTMEIFFILLYS